MMDAAEFEKKLNALPVEEPDEIDRAMLAEAAAVNDGTTIPLEDLEEYSGKLVQAMDVARKCSRIVKENIVFALGVKGLFLILGAFGLASMWEAVFADVGVAVIAIINSGRMLRTR